MDGIELNAKTLRTHNNGREHIIIMEEDWIEVEIPYYQMP